MGRQRSMSHMKEQNKALEKELNKMQTSNIPDAEFKTMVIRMLNAFLGSCCRLLKSLEGS